MKKLTAISFLTVILLSQTPLQQMLKLPILVQHFIEHRHQNKEISFVDYIVHHYLNGNQRDGDYDRDMQLPFRTNDVVLLGSVVVVPEQLTIDAPVPVFIEITYPIFSSHQLSAGHGISIWQPPRMAC